MRLRTQLKLKLVAFPFFLGLFFVAYFLVLKSPLFPVTVMPLTILDRWVPFMPEALLLYLSLWVYVSLAFLLLSRRAEFFEYGRGAVAIAVVGLAIFVFWPTAIPLVDIDWERHRSFIFLKTVDATGNACPSLHVAFAVFSGLWLRRLGREMKAGRAIQVGNWCWCAGIVYSTLATKQHVALDALAGAGLGLAGTFLTARGDSVSRAEA